MTVTAPAPNKLAARDAVENFPAPLLYVGWDQHMMFCAPLCVLVPGQTVFADLVQQLLPKLFGQHPDFPRIAWPRVQWFRSATLFTPAMGQTLAEQGFKHKSVLRFRTPGLEGLKGSCG